VKVGAVNVADRNREALGAGAGHEVLCLCGLSQGAGGDRLRDGQGAD